MILERVVITSRPEFTIRPVGVEAWLKSRLLLVTKIRETADCHSTTSWACTYRASTGVAELNDFDLCALTGVTMQL